MEDASPRLCLPFIVPGQAQKELFHNESLLRIDAALHPAAEDSQASPPPSPVPGACWIVSAGGQGAWSGHDGALALWTTSGWRFVAPVPGMRVWNKAQGLDWRWSGTAWIAGEVDCSRVRVNGDQVVGARQPAVPSPSGGTIIDTEARAALAGIIVALQQHGLID